jgi:tRNA G18 (ribose-2'-O)-methylase SpoU
VIYRCAAALGWDGLGVGPECTSPFSRRTLRVSMGNCLRLPGFKLGGRADFAELKRRGFLVVGTSVRPWAMSLDELRNELAELARVNPPDSPIRLALAFGNEFTGLDAEQEAACHRLATIPMHRSTDSLNVAVAAGIFMHELGPD